jgi:hypothetical protein
MWIILTTVTMNKTELNQGSSLVALLTCGGIAIKFQQKLNLLLLRHTLSMKYQPLSDPSANGASLGPTSWR